MKKIEAVIRPEKLDDVYAKIRKIGYPGLMLTEIGGQGRQGGAQAGWPDPLRVLFLPKLKLELVVEDGDVKPVCEAILAGARTGEIGDGKIFILDVKDAIRVRTGDRGAAALAPASRKARSRGR